MLYICFECKKCDIVKEYLLNSLISHSHTYLLETQHFADSF